jgi:hypothetical protein
MPIWQTKPVVIDPAIHQVAVGRLDFPHITEGGGLLQIDDLFFR